MIQYMICMQAYFWYKEKQVTLLWLTLYNLNIDYSFYLQGKFSSLWTTIYMSMDCPTGDQELYTARCPKIWQMPDVLILNAILR